MRKVQPPNISLETKLEKNRGVVCHHESDWLVAAYAANDSATICPSRYVLYLEINMIFNL